jgi:hypothetical protein
MEERLSIAQLEKGDALSVQAMARSEAVAAELAHDKALEVLNAANVASARANTDAFEKRAKANAAAAASAADIPLFQR